MTDAPHLMIPSLKAWLAVAGLLLGLGCSPVFAAWDVTQLMQGLAQNKSGRASFVEKKYIALLEQPVESSGELLYTAPGLGKVWLEVHKPRRSHPGGEVSGYSISG